MSSAAPAPVALSSGVARPPAPSERQLELYLSRIGFSGEARLDGATLRELHRRHVEAIAWENLDVYCGRPVTRDPLRAFEKIVERRRGGWCYEMNGLFAWMLEGLGFTVTRVAAGVMRETMGDAMLGNHLALLVPLDRIWLADVGLGSGLAEPIPLAEGEYRQRFATYRLEHLGGTWWRFHNQAHAMPPSFDFSTELTDEAKLEERCRWLQTDAASPLLGSAVVQRHFPDHLLSLIGSRRLRLDADGETSHQIADGDAYARTLEQSFGIALDGAADIWVRAKASEAEAEPARPSAVTA